VVNPSATTQRAMLEAGVTGSARAGSLRLSVRGVSLAPAPGNRLQVPLVLPPGTTTVSVSGPSDAGAGAARLTAPTVVAGAFDPFLRGVSGGPLTGIVGPPCRSVQVG
jgi:hypothetical protein